MLKNAFSIKQQYLKLCLLTANIYYRESCTYRYNAFLAEHMFPDVISYPCIKREINRVLFYVVI